MRRRLLCVGAATLGAAHPFLARAQGVAPRVVASFSILADMARVLAPPGIDVTALVGLDADAHVYEPTPADGRRLAQADLVIVNGLGFEGWIERMVEVSGYRGVVAIASKDITPRSEGHHGTDPHAWQDLALARSYVSNISAALAQRWPDRHDEIARRLTDYLARIDGLDRQVRAWLGAVPRDQRRVITSHDAFGYFGAAYGVDFLAPQGWTTHSEPSAAAVARLIRQIRKDNVRAIFVENISDPRLVERIAREGGVRIGGTLYSDALSKPGGPAATYLQMFEHNARSLALALQP
ncbi:MAG: metal ABC transporter solute-binding protein, Zn/Mn family [Lautropia sp.]